MLFRRTSVHLLISEHTWEKFTAAWSAEQEKIIMVTNLHISDAVWNDCGTPGEHDMKVKIILSIVHLYEE